MTTKRLSRKKQFRIALTARGLSLSEFARRNNVSRTHLYRVLDKPSESAPLTAKIEEVLKDTAA